MSKKTPSEDHTPKLAIIEWLDAFDGPTGWVDPREYDPKVVRPVSIGWVIPNLLHNHITLAGTLLMDDNEDGQVYYSNPAHIPMGMVQSLTYITIPDVIKDSLQRDVPRGLNAD